MNSGSPDWLFTRAVGFAGFLSVFFLFLVFVTEHFDGDHGFDFLDNRLGLGLL